MILFFFFFSDVRSVLTIKWGTQPMDTVCSQILGSVTQLLTLRTDTARSDVTREDGRLSFSLLQVFSGLGKGSMCKVIRFGLVEKKTHIFPHVLSNFIAFRWVYATCRSLMQAAERGNMVFVKRERASDRGVNQSEGVKDSKAREKGKEALCSGRQGGRENGNVIPKQIRLIKTDFPILSCLDSNVWQ